MTNDHFVIFDIDTTQYLEKAPTSTFPLLKARNTSEGFMGK